MCRCAVGHNLAGGGHVVGDYFESGIGTDFTGFGVVGTHVDGVRCVGVQADEGVARGVDHGPVGDLGAVGYAGYLPCGLVGEQLHVAFPFDRDGRVSNIGNKYVGYGGHGIVGGEDGAHPRREVIAAADVLYIYIIGSGILQTGEDDALRVEAGAGGSHAVQLLVGQVGRGAEDIVEVVGLVGFGLLPAHGGGGLAGDFGDHVAHRAAGTEGAEAGLLPGAHALVAAIGVADGANKYVVLGVGVEVVEGVAEAVFNGNDIAVHDGSSDGVVANLCVADDGVLAEEQLVAAHIVARRGGPADGGAALSDVAHHDLGNRRAGVGLHAVLERNFR